MQSGKLLLAVALCVWCLPSDVRSRSKIAPVSCAKARLTRRALSSRRLPHIRQRAEFSLPCLGVYHWLRTQAPLTPARQDRSSYATCTQAPLTPARQDRSSYATFASAHLRHGALASLGNIDRTPVRCIHRLQRNASSAEYRLLALRRVPPRIRRTEPLRVAQLATRHAAPLPHYMLNPFKQPQQILTNI